MRLYKTYVACNKRIDGRGSSPSPKPPKATSHVTHYKPRFHKTTAFAALVEEPQEDTNSPESPFPDEADSKETESPQSEDEGLYIPAYLEEALPDNLTLQVKMGHTMRAQERKTRWCWQFNQPGHLQRDHDKFVEKNRKGPLPLKGPPQNKLAQEGFGPKPSQPIWVGHQEGFQKSLPYLNSDPFGQFIGSKNWGQAMIDGEVMTCLLDNGSQLNFVTPAYARE